MNDVIISITTVPCRKQLLKKVIPYLIGQNYFSKLVINLDNNLTEEDYDFYEKEIAIQDKRIEIYKDCEAKWRSCNKLLPTIQRYPDDIVITMDDDFSYNSNYVKSMLEEYIKYPDCIIAQEINPILLTNNKEIFYLNTIDLKFKQKEFGKYLTNCCLFPPHVFDGTDVFDYDKMMKITNGTNDELWFWINSTLNGIGVIGLDETYSITADSEIKHEEGDYQLTNTNKLNETLDFYNKNINEYYGKQLFDVFERNPIEFYINNKNFTGVSNCLTIIKNIYGNFPKIYFVCDETIKPSHISYISFGIKMAEFNNSVELVLKEV